MKRYLVSSLDQLEALIISLTENLFYSYSDFDYDTLEIYHFNNTSNPQRRGRYGLLDLVWSYANRDGYRLGHTYRLKTAISMGLYYKPFKKAECIDD